MTWLNGKLNRFFRSCQCIGDDFSQSSTFSNSSNLTTEFLCRSQFTRCPIIFWKTGWQAIVTINPSDFFKEVRFDSDIPTATWNANCEGFCISRKAKSKTTEDILYIRVGKLSTKDTVNVCKSRRNFYIRSIQVAC